MLNIAPIVLFYITICISMSWIFFFVVLELSEELCSLAQTNCNWIASWESFLGIVLFPLLLSLLSTAMGRWSDTVSYFYSISPVRLWLLWQISCYFPDGFFQQVKEKNLLAIEQIARPIGDLQPKGLQSCSKHLKHWFEMKMRTTKMMNKTWVSLLVFSSSSCVRYSKLHTLES